MNGRTLPGRAASVTALAAAAILCAGGTAAADAEKSPVEQAIEQLTTAAGDNTEARAAVTTVSKGAQLVAAAKLGDIGFRPFGYTAPTIGCGHNLPFTMTAASATPGMVDGPELGLAGPPGTLRFQATPAHSGMPLSSGLSVAWLNVGNGRSGISPLADLTEYNLPALATTVDSGPGTVVASLWGTIDYPAARCVVLPTVGLFTVAELPKVDGEPATTGSGGSSDSGSSGSGDAPAPADAAPAAPAAPPAS